MSARLVVIAGPDRGKAFSLPSAGTVLIGRGRGAAIGLADPHASRSHCQVKVESGGILIEDLNSVSGIYVNDARVSTQPLRSGDVVLVGSTQFRLEMEELADQATIAPPAGPSRGGIAPPLFAPAVPMRLPAVPLGSPPPVRAPASPPPPPQPALPPLYELSGKPLTHFQIGPVIAPGKTGVVFRALDTRDSKEVALKVFFPDFSRDEEEVQRFLRAMKTTLPLRHPHLVAINGAGKSSSLCWVSMELIEGPSLAQAVQQAAAGAGDWRIAVRTVLHVARALAFLHAKHIYHRNICPTNLLMSAPSGDVKVGDLMKAKAQEGALAKQITQAGEIVGDLAFLSPEQTTNASAGDGRADLYSLGAVAYALLVGRSPVESKNFVEMILKIRQTPPIPPRQFQPGLPPALDALVMKLLAKRPEDRFQTAAELFGHLKGIASDGA